MADQPAEAQPGAAERPDDLTGQTLGEFEMVRRIGRGGMGEVYLARQKSLKRQVAVKVLRSDLAANVTALKRFKAEAETVARINHANIVQVHAIGEERGLHYMAMEYVEGRNLKEYMAKKGTPDLPIALNIMRQIAAALTRAGELGFVHRDIKPENILLTRKGEVKVADFGLSRCFANTDQALNITQSGVTMGTPLYMSPEQVQGRTVDPRSDLYSFGVTSYHMLKGEPPFRGATAFEVAIQHVQNEPPSLAEARPDLPPDLCLLVHKLMAKKPEDRYQSPRDVLRELARIREGLPLAHPPAPLLSGAQAVTGVGTSALSGSQTAMVPVAAPMPRWLAPLAGMAAAAGLGVGLNALLPLPHADAAKEHAFEMPATLSPAKKRIAELQASLNSSSLKLEVAYENLLELVLLHVRERQFEEALQLLDPANLNKRAALADGSKPRDPALGRLGLVSMLGKAIVLAGKDEAKASLDTFQALLESLKGKKGLLADPMRAVDDFLKQNPAWKKGVADALERDAVNLGTTTKLDPAWDNHRSYLPKFAPPAKPKDK